MDLRKVFIRAITIPALTNGYISLQSGIVAGLIVTRVNQSSLDIVLVTVTMADGLAGTSILPLLLVLVCGEVWLWR